jgi:hypothetical protein
LPITCWQSGNPDRVTGAKRQHVIKPTMLNAPVLEQFPDIGYRGRPN